jgi:hypothetical protein
MQARCPRPFVAGLEIAIYGYSNARVSDKYGIGLSTTARALP